MHLFDLALPHARRAVELRQALLGPTHPDTLAAKCTLSFMVPGPEAEALLKDAVRVYEATLPADHDETLRAKFALAWAYARQGKFDLSEGLFREVMTKWKRIHGVDSPGYLAPMEGLADLYVLQHRDEEAEAQFKEVLASPLGKDWLNLSDGRAAVLGLADLYMQQERYELAEPLLKELLAANELAYGIDHQHSLVVRTKLAWVYLAQGKRPEAEALESDFAASWKPKPGEDSLHYTDGIVWVCRHYLRQKKWADAEPLLRTGLDMRRLQSPDAWQRFNIQLMLGEALLGQGKHDEAKPLLREGYEGMKQREAKITRTSRFRFHEIVGRLAVLCEAANQKQEAADWRKELETTEAYIRNSAEAWRPYALLRSGKTAEAIARTAELTKEATWNSKQWYDFACVYAVASSKVAGKKQEYADRAMELLHKAVKAGYDDSANMGEDLDLFSLRERDDFKKLLAELIEAFPVKNAPTP
jgi:tetratricopeptide (TPR) repeat protein